MHRRTVAVFDYRGARARARAHTRTRSGENITIIITKLYDLEPTREMGPAAITT